MRWPGSSRTRSSGIALAYHRIGDPGQSQLDHALWSANAEVFEAQVRFLGAHADVVRVRELADALAQRGTRAVAITFDDGYRDNHDVALPILRARGVPATFFVSTDFIDHPRTPWWDEIAWMVRSAGTQASAVALAAEHGGVPQHADLPEIIRRALRRAKQQPGDQLDAFIARLGDRLGTGRIPEALAPAWMSWEMIRALDAGGMEVGGHTATHPVLSRLSRAAQQHELAASWERLSQMLGSPPTSMSYPVGGLDATNGDTRSAIATTRWRLACHYHGGWIDGAITDPYGIPRIAVEPYTRVEDLAAILRWPAVFS